MNPIVFPHNLADAFSGFTERYDRIAIVVDKNTATKVLPMLQHECNDLRDAVVTVVNDGEESKNLATVEKLWDAWLQAGITRNSVVINIGGGIVTDLGGFAAATWLRGIPFVNVPTTVLAMVDASVGGKTGFNFHNRKNCVGVFAEPLHIIMLPQTLHTLPVEHRFAGLAEMLKHALLTSEEMVEETLALDMEKALDNSFVAMLHRNIAVKQRFVESDPRDNGVRHALNFGHTFAHAFEALALQKGQPVLHGNAVAWGMLAALWLSHVRLGFPKQMISTLMQWVRENYAVMPFDCNDYDSLLTFMMGDKKNGFNQIRTVLLANIGYFRTGEVVSKDEVFEALDFIREF